MPLLTLLLACGPPADSVGKPARESAESPAIDTGEPPESGETGQDSPATVETAETADTADTADTVDTADTTDTVDTVDTAPVDGDGDGFLVEDGDCDDTNAAVHPGATEVCNGVDDNCDGSEADAVDMRTWHPDADGDGYGGASTLVACTAPVGFVEDANDCEDADSGVHPGATELCDAADVDEDCDGLADDADPSVPETSKRSWYQDSDGDTFGSAYTSVDACDAPAGFVDNNQDCDDVLPTINPDAVEVCDAEGLDEDCDGREGDGDSSVTGTSPWFEDADGDGYGSTVVVYRCEYAPGVSADSLDCDDTNARISPLDAEICDAANTDEDCDGLVDDDDPDATGQHPVFVDGDGDGFGSKTTPRCDLAAGFAATNDDCDDNTATTSPAADEVCDDVDNNCDGDIDNDPVDGMEVTADVDRDGYGADTGTMNGCVEVDNRLDCDDADAVEPIVVDDDGHGSRDEDLLDPVETIQEGIDLARLCVIVAPGTYPGEINFGGNSVRVVSTDGAEATIIEADDDYGVAFTSGETASAELDGFTITGGTGAFTSDSTIGSCGSAEVCTLLTYRYKGGGVYIEGAAPTLRNLEIHDARLPGYYASPLDESTDRFKFSYGGGIYVGNSDTIGIVDISNVNLTDNEAMYGGGLCVASDATVVLRDSRVGFNRALSQSKVDVYGIGAGIAVLGSTANLTIENVLVVGNDGGGGAYVEDGAATLTNVTLVGNGEIGLSVMGMGTLDLRSSIVHESGTGVFVEAGATYTGAYDNVSSYVGITDPTGTGGNLSTDPLFVDWTDDDIDNDDLHLAAGSPSIDAGDPDPSYNDLDGTRNDQGAYGGPGGE